MLAALPVCLSTALSVCWSSAPSVCLSVALFVCLPTWLFSHGSGRITRRQIAYSRPPSSGLDALWPGRRRLARAPIRSDHHRPTSDLDVLSMAPSGLTTVGPCRSWLLSALVWHIRCWPGTRSGLATLGPRLAWPLSTAPCQAWPLSDLASVGLRQA